jgi:hypothetical protein
VTVTITVTVTTNATSRCTRNQRIKNRKGIESRLEVKESSPDIPPLSRCLDLRYLWEVLPPEPSPLLSGRLVRLGVTHGVHLGGNPTSASRAATSPSGGLGSVAFGFHLLELLDVVVDWRGFTLGGCLLLHSGCMSTTATGAAA